MSLAEPVHADVTHADSSVVSVRRLLREDGVTSETDDAVVAEVPVAMSFNDISYAVMMATPCDLEDFILGLPLARASSRVRAPFTISRLSLRIPVSLSMLACLTKPRIGCNPGVGLWLGLAAAVSAVSSRSSR